MRATGPYSIGALAGKGMHDACRARALTAAGAKAIALAALVFCLSGPAHADAGAETDNALATLCGIVEASAKAEGLPADFFTKLIWRESSFRPNAVSPAGAQGVAQFMPGTANERGLIDPFDPAVGDPRLREVPERTEAPLRQSGSGGGRLQRQAPRRPPTGSRKRDRFRSKRRITCSPSPATPPTSGGATSRRPSLRQTKVRPA